MTATNLSPSLPTAAAPARSESSRHDQHLVHRLKATSTSSPAPLATTTTPQDSLQSTLPLPELAPQDAFQSSALLSGQTLPGEQTTGTLPQDPADMGEMNGLSHQLSNSSDDGISARRPTTPRSQTDPSSDTPSYFQQARPRNRSPYSRSHLRSQSGSATLTAPPMTRAHSLPTVMNSTGHLSLSPSPMPHARPASPLRSPKRTRSPRITPLLEPRISIPGQQYGAGLRSASVGSFEGAPSVCDISEDAELELTPKAGNGLSTMYSSTSSLSRRRRPASPLYQVSMSFGTPTSAPSVSTPTSTASSPLLNPAKFNEPFPGYSSSLASSSVPSTPTSMRSRSPSISSLETIPDSPDAEEEALEADRIARLKAAADREDGEEARRSSLDVPGDSRRSFGFGKRDSRKRWSVCGAERRGDLDLETIWED